MLGQVARENPSSSGAKVIREPRPHQKRAIAGIWSTWEEDPALRPCVVCPTGGGKSFIADYVLSRSKRPVVISHTDTLRRQLAANIPSAWSLTVQSIISKGPRGASIRKALQECDAAAIDECHHYPANAYKEALDIIRSAKVFGLTATPVRMDGRPLGDLFHRLIETASYSELIEQGYLLPMDVWRPEFTRAEQKSRGLRIDTVAAYLQHARSAPDVHTIWFGEDVAACGVACARLTEAGVRAAVISSRSKKAERAQLIADYAAGKIEVLASPVLLSEGFDVPATNVVVLDRSCEHIALFLQMCGRGLRPYPGQDRALLLDPRDACSIHGRPTDDREYSLSGKGMQLKRTRSQVAAQERAERVAEELQDIEARFSLQLDRVMSRYAELLKEARDRGHAPGWAMHRVASDLGVAPPKVMHAKAAVVCRQCGHRVKVGETITWTGSRETWHPRCWFDRKLKESPSARAWAAGKLAK
jgi:superfamily II DNA or RNA helicase